MYLKQLKIKNFRPIGEDGLEFSFPANFTTLLGENNVGKTTIFKAINKILYHPSPQEWKPEEWHAGDRKKILEIQIDCVLDDEIILRIIELMQLPITIDQYKSVFSNEISYRFYYGEKLFGKHLKMGVFHIDNGQGWVGELGKIERIQEYSSTPFSEFFKGVFSENDVKHQMRFIHRYLDTHANKKPTNSVIIGIPRSDWVDSIIKSFQGKFIFITEYREKPQKALSNFLVSPTGKELSSMLFNLKNGKDTEEKFERIRKNFESLFPQQKLNVFRNIESNEIELLFTKEGVKSTTSYVGAGILESLLLLTHLEAYKNHIFLIDHPETHLHPHAQRRLNSIIENSDDNQILIITHSPYFTNFNRKSRIFRLSQKDQKTIKTGSPEDFFSEMEYFKLDQFLDSTTKELFFARKIILVEGPTEIGALPIFSNAMELNLDEHGISLINVDGKFNFPIFAKICESFKIPYIMLADHDAQPIIEKIKTQFKDSEAIILPKDFDALLPNDLLEDAQSRCGNSKPRVGRYIAHKMLEKGIPIPAEIQNLFSRLHEI